MEGIAVVMNASCVQSILCVSHQLFTGNAKTNPAQAAANVIAIAATPMNEPNLNFLSSAKSGNPIALNKIIVNVP